MIMALKRATGGCGLSVRTLHREKTESQNVKKGGRDAFFKERKVMAESCGCVCLENDKGEKLQNLEEHSLVTMKREKELCWSSGG